MNCAEIIANLKYVEIVLSIQYSWRMVDMTKLRPKPRQWQSMVSDKKALSRIEVLV